MNRGFVAVRMKTRKLLLGVLCIAPLAAAAGEWQPDPDKVFELTVRSTRASPATPSEDRWVESLLRGLSSSGAKPEVVYRFSRAEADFSVAGKPRQDAVFAYRDNP